MMYSDGSPDVQEWLTKDVEPCKTKKELTDYLEDGFHLIDIYPNMGYTVKNAVLEHMSVILHMRDLKSGNLALLKLQSQMEQHRNPSPSSTSTQRQFGFQAGREKTTLNE